MSIPPDYARPRRSTFDSDILREIAALALVVLGAFGVVVAAFLQDRELGIATVSAVVLATGVYLGLER